MHSPFNFDMQLPIREEDGEVYPVQLRVLQSRPSRSRRGGHVIVLGLAGDREKVLPLETIRLGMN
jgi:hypothetical protein